MIINDIRYVESDTTRKDGRYPLRIGSDVEFLVEPKIGEVMILDYKSDNQGNPKKGLLRTSVVRDIYQTETELVIITINSIYCFNKSKQEIKSWRQI